LASADPLPSRLWRREIRRGVFMGLFLPGSADTALTRD
jgi:hypothetical protein